MYWYFKQLINEIKLPISMYHEEVLAIIATESLIVSALSHHCITRKMFVLNVFCLSSLFYKYFYLYLLNSFGWCVSIACAHLLLFAQVFVKPVLSLFFRYLRATDTIPGPVQSRGHGIHWCISAPWEGQPDTGVWGARRHCNPRVCVELR